MGKARTTGCREQERVVTDQLCYGCESKEHKIQKCNKKNNIFVTSRERGKIKEDKMREIMEEYREVKNLKLRFYPNNTKNKAMISFSTEEEAQVAITEVNTYERWRTELYKPIRKSREFERQRNQIITTRNRNKEKTTKYQLSKQN